MVYEVFTNEEHFLHCFFLPTTLFLACVQMTLKHSSNIEVSGVKSNEKPQNIL